MIRVKRRFNGNFIKKRFDAENLQSSDIIRSHNMIPEEKGFSTRPGMKLLPDPVIFDPWEFSDGYTEFTLTDFFTELDGKTAQIAVAVEDDGYSNINYHITAIFENGEKQSLGMINFARTDSETFGVPKNFCIYTGKKTMGGGIYFLTSVGYANKPDDYRIYEIDENLSKWYVLGSERCYIPTVLLYGRGDNVESAFFEYGIDFHKVVRPEPKNLLGGNFSCRYTTDGFSHSFTLPSFETDGAEILCTAEIAAGKYVEWEIGETDNKSADANVDGEKVHICLDREKGRIFFETGDGYPYQMPYYAMENNLMFVVRSKGLSSSLGICSMKNCCKVTGRATGGNSAVNIFSGSDQNPERIVWQDPENPLYFPETCSLNIPLLYGSPDKVCPLDDRVLIFRKKKIYSAKVTAAESYNISDMLKGGTEGHTVGMPRLDFERQATLFAEVIPDTVCNLGEHIYFALKNGSIGRTNKNLALKSYGISLETLPEAATIYKGKLLLLCGGECSVCSPEESNEKVLCWSLPVSVFAASAFAGETVFYSKDENGGIFAFTLSAEADSYFGVIDGARTLCHKDIESFVAVRLLDTDGKAKLYTVMTECDCAAVGARLKLFDGTRQIGYHRIEKGENYLRRPAVISSLSAELCFTKAARLKAVGLRYSKLNKI